MGLSASQARMTVSKNNPVNNYAGDSSVTQFDFDFLIEDSSELLVQHTNSSGEQKTLTLDVDYSIHEVGNKNGSYITFPIAGSSYSTLASNEVISLSLTLDIEQDKEYANSNKLNFSTLEWSFDYITRILQIMSRLLARAVKIQEGSNIDTDTLAVNLNKVADISDDVSTVAANTSDISTVADDIAKVNTVSGSIANVNAVGNSISDVNTVAADLTNVDTVATNISDVNTVATDILDVNTVADNMTDVNTVADNMTDVNTVVTNISDVNTVADKITNVNTVATNIAKVNTAATNINNINTVAGISGNVTTVADKITNVNTVATNINNINTVAGISSNVTTVADKITNVNTVATNIQSVDNCSDNMDAIKEAPDYAQFAADCLASCQSIKGQFSLVSFLSGGSSANILQEDIYDGGSSSVLSENVYSGGNSEYKNVLTYDDIKNVHEITALQALVKTLVDRIEALENIKTISGGVAVA